MTKSNLQYPYEGMSLTALTGKFFKKDPSATLFTQSQFSHASRQLMRTLGGYNMQIGFTSND